MVLSAIVRVYHCVQLSVSASVSVLVLVPLSVCVCLSARVSLSALADAQMAHLVKQGLASGVITEDSDMLPYGLLNPTLNLEPVWAS